MIVGSLGLIAGGYPGASIADAPRNARTHVGLCLLPQAGVALGLALFVSERYPKVAPQVLSVIVGTTIVLEILGPVTTRFALANVGEVAKLLANELKKSETARPARPKWGEWGVIGTGKQQVLEGSEDDFASDPQNVAAGS